MRVPLARRNLFSEWRRAALGLAGVATAFVMVLALDGIFAGAMKQITRYIDTADADVFVSQRGVKTMHMSSSAVPLDAVDAIRTVRGVKWVEPILFESDALSATSGQRLSYVIGYRPGRPGGPVEIADGSAPGPGEIVVEARALDDLGLRVGDRLDVLGRSWTVSGTTRGMTNIVNTVSYVRFEDLAAARGLTRTVSYVLVGLDETTDHVIDALRRATGLTVLRRPEFSREEARIVRDMSTEIMQIMTLAAFLIGLAVTGLVLYATTLSRIREVGVMKALGARTSRLAGVVLGQAAWTVGGAILVALPVSVALAVVASRLTNVAITIQPASLGRVVVGGVVLGAFGAVAPLMRVARVDPVSVFRR